MLMIVCLSSFTLFSVTTESENNKQSKRQIRREQRKLRKEKAKEEAEKMAILTAVMVENQSFILEANMLFDRYGNTENVSASTNFVSVTPERGVLQLAFDDLDFGFNGLGGITCAGQVTKYDYKKLKHGGYQVQYSIFGANGSFDVSMSIQPSGFAMATIRGNWGEDLKYQGKIIPAGKSGAYEGMIDYTL
ncbi:hypothetical protein PEPS_44350 (plasmid) [Persicobacter psychrovividus]|uniref:DUF4251 domain-containing protein n=2 Tax=Persicobacter psychrovividus TaxID=387638 RepID=A0ABM7VMC1_9BACT|nr:hypothetical protein PEPS_44350 [Persicobacter psychrovividus]